MRKKLLSILSLFLASALFLTACGSESAGTEAAVAEDLQVSSSDGPVSLRIWGAEDDAELLDVLVENFKKTYPETSFDITVEYCAESECRGNVLNDVLNAPDVFTFADDQLSAFVSSGVLKAVENADEIKGRNLEAAVSAASVDGTLYSYPLTADNGYFLYYNKKYLSASDVNSMDNILAIAEENEKLVTMDMSSAWYLYAFFGNTGLEVGLNPDGITNYCTWNSIDNPIKGVDVATAMYELALNPGFTNGGDSVLSEGAANDTVIAGVSGVWLANTMKEAWGSNYAAAKLPTYTVDGQQVQLSSYSGYKLVGVNSYSNNKEWAAKFADFMTNEESQTLRFEMRGQGPSNTSSASSDAVAASPAIQALLAQSEFASLQRVGGKYWSPAGEFGGLMASGDIEGIDLQEYMDKMVSEITESN